MSSLAQSSGERRSKSGSPNEERDQDEQAGSMKKVEMTEKKENSREARRLRKQAKSPAVVPVSPISKEEDEEKKAQDEQDESRDEQGSAEKKPVRQENKFIQSLTQLIFGENGVLKPADFPLDMQYNDATVLSVISLKEEQEKLKREQLKQENLAKSIELIKLAKEYGMAPSSILMLLNSAEPAEELIKKIQQAVPTPETPARLAETPAERSSTGSDTLVIKPPPRQSSAPPMRESHQHRQFLSMSKFKLLLPPSASANKKINYQFQNWTGSKGAKSPVKLAEEEDSKEDVLPKLQGTQSLSKPAVARPQEEPEPEEEEEVDSEDDSEDEDEEEEYEESVEEYDKLKRSMQASVPQHRHVHKRRKHWAMEALGHAKFQMQQQAQQQAHAHAQAQLQAQAQNQAYRQRFQPRHGRSHSDSMRHSRHKIIGSPSSELGQEQYVHMIPQPMSTPVPQKVPGAAGQPAALMMPNSQLLYRPPPNAQIVYVNSIDGYQHQHARLNAIPLPQGTAPFLYSQPQQMASHFQGPQPQYGYPIVQAVPHNASPIYRAVSPHVESQYRRQQAQQVQQQQLYPQQKRQLQLQQQQQQLLQQHQQQQHQQQQLQARAHQYQAEKYQKLGDPLTAVPGQRTQEGPGSKSKQDVSFMIMTPKNPPK